MHLFNPASATRGLILLAPGGGQDHTTPGVVARATRLTDEGYAVAVVRSLDEVPAVLAEHPGPVGFSVACTRAPGSGWPCSPPSRGLPLPVLGLADGPLTSAPLVTAAVLFYVQSDDDLVQPNACRYLRRARLDRQNPDREPRWSPRPAADIDRAIGWLAGPEAGRAVSPGQDMVEELVVGLCGSPRTLHRAAQVPPESAS